jgi:hypothetical protein
VWDMVSDFGSEEFVNLRDSPQRRSIRGWSMRSFACHGHEESTHGKSK